MNSASGHGTLVRIHLHLVDVLSLPCPFNNAGHVDFTDWGYISVIGSIEEQDLDVVLCSPLKLADRNDIVHRIHRHGAGTPSLNFVFGPGNHATSPVASTAKTLTELAPVTEPDESEVEQVWFQQLFQGGGQITQSKDDLRKQLKEEQAMQAREDFFRVLREKAGVKIYLLPPALVPTIERKSASLRTTLAQVYKVRNSIQDHPQRKGHKRHQNENEIRRLVTY